MRTFKLTLAYDGTRYVGWQHQKNGVSIQAVVEEALAPIDPSGSARVAGAGRTDAGVHARGQVASWRSRCALDAPTIQRAVNARLPDDIRVTEVTDADADFHARFSARWKTYEYLVLNAAVSDPLVRHVVWHIPQALDGEAMRMALAPLCGRHDFRAFQAAGSRVATTVRTVFAASLEAMAAADTPGGPASGSGLRAGPSSGRLLTFRFEGDGFLRHMVRNMVGTVIEVGLGRREASSLAGLLVQGDRRNAGATAPPQGLVLVSVAYGERSPLAANSR